MTSLTRDDKTEKFYDLIDRISVAMLATHAGDGGGLRTRPMWVRRREGDAEHLYCFTREDTGKIAELQLDQSVNLSFADKRAQEFVSVTGKADISRDPDLIHDLWDEAMLPWFSDGPDDPRIAVIRVRIDYGEYWDAPAASMITAYGWAKAKLASADVQDPGDNAKIPEPAD